MPRVSLFLVLQAVSILGSALTVFKLHQTGLHRRYRIFFVYFVYRVPLGLCALVLDVKSSFYLYFWRDTLVLSWIFYVLIVRELYGLVLENYQGLRTLGRWFMYFGTVVSLAISILTLLPKFTPATPQRSKNIGYVLAADRGITLSLAIFLLVIVLLLSRYPVRLPRNVLIHAFLYTTFFLANSLTMLLKSVFGLQVYTTVDSGLMAVASACGLAWFWLLTAKGEEVTVHLPQLDAGREERLLSQLDTLNQTLLKAGKS